MGFSIVGKQQLAAHVGLLLVNCIVLAFSARVNQFQEYFFVADLFPLALSIITSVVLFIMIIVDFGFRNAFTARAPFVIGVLSVFTVFWLAFNAFSTSRWRYVPMDCDTIPETLDERTWCKDVQALKAFVWIEWVSFLVTLLFTLRFTHSEYSRGYKHVLKMPLSRYSPSAGIPDPLWGGGFEKMSYAY